MRAIMVLSLSPELKIKIAFTCQLVGTTLLYRGMTISFFRNTNLC